MGTVLARAVYALSVAGFLMVTAAGVAPRPAVAAASAIGDAGAFVQRFGDEVVEIIRRRDLSPAARQERLRRILADNIDLKSVSRAALGRYWRMATDRQRARYEAIYPDYMVARYGALFAHYTGATLMVTRGESAIHDNVLVNGNVERAAGPPIKMAFRVRRTNDGFKVLDIIVEGVSLLFTQRSEFASVINRDGVEGFLARLDEVTRRISPPADANGDGAGATVAGD